MIHTFLTLREAERLDGLTEEGRDLDRAVLNALAFNEPNRLIKEECPKFRRRIRKLADPDGKHLAEQKRQSAALIEEMATRYGGPK